MQNQGLIFIPDISGFTTFIHATEIEHSRHIVAELLEVIIDSNSTGLHISEIEGDAILFYKHTPIPDLASIHQLVETMFQAFHAHLRHYEENRICGCGACVGASNLTLKFICHFGEFATYQVKQYNKLLGTSIITAHRLLKNSVPGTEYWLISQDLLSNVEGDISLLPLTWEEGTANYDGQSVNFLHTNLTFLKETLPLKKQLNDTPGTTASPDLHLSRKVNANMYSLMQVITDLSQRNQWLVGVKSIDQNKHLINQINNTHRCVLDNRCTIVYTKSFRKESSALHYVEFIEGMGEVSYRCRALDSNTTQITIDLSLLRNRIMQLMFKVLKKKKVSTNFYRSIDRLTDLATKQNQIAA
jgi:hypothetical protein